MRENKEELKRRGNLSKREKEGGVGKLWRGLQRRHGKEQLLKLVQKQRGKHANVLSELLCKELNRKLVGGLQWVLETELTGLLLNQRRELLLKLRRRLLLKPGIGLQQKELLLRELNKMQGEDPNEQQWKGPRLRFGRGKLLRLERGRQQQRWRQRQEKNRVNQMILSPFSVWVPEQTAHLSKGLQQW
jgi:hypothetical protein